MAAKRVKHFQNAGQIKESFDTLMTKRFLTDDWHQVRLQLVSLPNALSENVGMPIKAIISFPAAENYTFRFLPLYASETERSGKRAHTHARASMCV